MRYPKECFSIDENATQNAMREYEHKRDLWYAEAVKLYPNYWQMEFNFLYQLYLAFLLRYQFHPAQNVLRSLPMQDN